jgi:hypothetical protein
MVNNCKITNFSLYSQVDRFTPINHRGIAFDEICKQKRLLSSVDLII